MFYSYCLCTPFIILLYLRPFHTILAHSLFLAPVLPGLSHFFCLLPTCLLTLDMSKYTYTIFMVRFFDLSCYNCKHWISLYLLLLSIFTQYYF